MQICFLIKRKIEIWQIFSPAYDNFGKNHTPLMSNGMATIPKTQEKSWDNILYYFFSGRSLLKMIRKIVLVLMWKTLVNTRDRKMFNYIFCRNKINFHFHTLKNDCFKIEKVLASIVLLIQILLLGIITRHLIWAQTNESLFLNFLSSLVYLSYFLLSFCVSIAFKSFFWSLLVGGGLQTEHIKMFWK